MKITMLMSSLIDNICQLTSVQEKKLIFKTEGNSLEITRYKSKSIPPDILGLPNPPGPTSPPQPLAPPSKPPTVFQAQLSPATKPAAATLSAPQFQSRSGTKAPGTSSSLASGRPFRFNCLCGYATNKKSNYDKHIKCVHFKEKYECKVCGKAVSNLPQHMRVTHLTSSKKLSSAANEKIRSQTLQSQDKPAASSELPKLPEKSRKRTKQRIEPESGRKICPHCDKPYSNLEQHIKIVHEKIKNFECVNCKKKFYDNRELRNHHLKSLQTGQCQQLVSTKLKKHKCERCDYRASSKSNLQTHWKSVHLQQKHACPACNLLLSSRPNLNNHLKKCKQYHALHPGEKDFKRIFFPCKLCDYSTPRPSHLDRHILSVHGTEAFETVTSVYQNSASNFEGTRARVKLPQFVNLVNFESIEGLLLDDFDFAHELNPQQSQQQQQQDLPTNSETSKDAHAFMDEPGGQGYSGNGGGDSSGVITGTQSFVEDQISPNAAAAHHAHFLDVAYKATSTTNDNTAADLISERYTQNYVIQTAAPDNVAVADASKQHLYYHHPQQPPQSPQHQGQSASPLSMPQSVQERSQLSILGDVGGPDPENITSTGELPMEAHQAKRETVPSLVGHEAMASDRSTAKISLHDLDCLDLVPFNTEGSVEMDHRGDRSYSSKAEVDRGDRPYSSKHKISDYILSQASGLEYSSSHPSPLHTTTVYDSAATTSANSAFGCLGLPPAAGGGDDSVDVTASLARATGFGPRGTSSGISLVIDPSKH